MYLNLQKLMALKPKAPSKMPRKNIFSRMCKYFRAELTEDVLFGLVVLGVPFFLMYQLFTEAAKY